MTKLEPRLRQALGEDIALALVLPSGLWNTAVDLPQLENALLNLTNNARDAIGGAGRVTIEAGNAVLDAPYCRVHGDALPGQYVRLAVTDTGPGMAPEVQARAFEPFFSTREGGSGLGLSMLHGFVKQSGGHVTIESAPGQGATVALYLPRAGSCAPRDWR